MLKRLKLLLKKAKYRRVNKHNETSISSLVPINKIKVGRSTYGKLNITFYDKQGRIEIGNYCSIADDVRFLIGGAHDYKRISLYPFQTKTYKLVPKDAHKSFIVVEDDVWIGHGSLILTDVKIGKGSVIGARSIVTKDVPPYSVYIGNRVYKKRFPTSIIEKLKSIDYSTIEHEKGDCYEKYCQEQINDDNVDLILKAFCCLNMKK